MRRALLLFVALLALAAPLSGCGGDDGDDSSATSEPSASQPTTDPTVGATGDGGGADGRGAGEDGSDASSGGEGGGSQGEESAGTGDESGRVDLTVDPGRIRGAVVTGTGAVQTLPPDEEAQQTAQENSYSSIKAFGEEAQGEEATNITFALVQYLTAKAEGDWATACARLYSVLRENVERGGEGCPEAYGAMMSRAPKSVRLEQTKIDVSSIRRGDGNRAFVIYKTPDTLSADMPMYVEDGVWKVGALEAYMLTPEQAG
jgi:hypothetical protein